ncbi:MULTISPECIES: Arc family DNA-binding protein [Proteus]|uniref:Arc family DNA-binding protein n=1 Tax=Proteus TaxID=583 RepID=UPI0018C53545|nr:Arc family DNA-binding protein [Proteus mirabilis]MBG2993220.1 Arc family DNA-binding protein [Proteus mirabilis]MCL8583064.1 Arc family DNA-binding protein [Proteus mirabilis]MCY9777881.1 Arc family DNA-binding protein [Proteus mirabilis]MCY9779939.1 Arc family DNA-binding protein [Proteus mirabilis]MCY9788582.1 Arc family DNA-binding protein [Proteus mirabilis]
MSREDPQLRIRLPIELKEKIEVTAKENGRSMNAEIVQRLDSSFLGEINDDDLISAKDAIKIANNAKEEIKNIIFKRTFDEINKKIRLGHEKFYIDLNGLELEDIDEDVFESLFDTTFSKLKELGYYIWDEAWSVDGFMVEIPKEPSHTK